MVYIITDAASQTYIANTKIYMTFYSWYVQSGYVAHSKPELTYLVETSKKREQAMNHILILHILTSPPQNTYEHKEVRRSVEELRQQVSLIGLTKLRLFLSHYSLHLTC
jgi:hypothetical protein